MGMDLSHSINYKCPVIVICDAHKSWSKHLVYLDSTLSSVILSQSRGSYKDFAFQDASLLFFPCFFSMILMGITRKILNKIFFLVFTLGNALKAGHSQNNDPSAPPGE
jgi:hypothetical protein